MKPQAKPKIVSLVGLTASGKSAIGIELARTFDCEIISADSRQVYRGLDLGSGKVTPEEQRLAPHHLLDIVEPGEKFDVFTFQKLAYETIDNILARGKVPIIVGGTGLYSRSVVEGYVFEKSGKSTKTSPRYEVLQICLLPPKEYLAQLIKQRLLNRLDQGMLEETEQLIKKGTPKKWLESLGLEYYWNVQLLDGKITREQYKYWLLTKSLQFAKRQRTWFKREKQTHFLTEPSTFLQECKTLTSEFLKSNTKQ